MTVGWLVPGEGDERSYDVSSEGTIGAEFLAAMLRKRWIARERDSRALRLTGIGEREVSVRFGVRR